MIWYLIWYLATEKIGTLILRVKFSRLMKIDKWTKSHFENKQYMNNALIIVAQDLINQKTFCLGRTFFVKMFSYVEENNFSFYHHWFPWHHSIFRLIKKTLPKRELFNASVKCLTATEIQLISQFVVVAKIVILYHSLSLKVFKRLHTFLSAWGRVSNAQLILFK